MLYETRLTYQSTVDGTGPLSAIAVYDDERTAMPLMAVLGGFTAGHAVALLPELRHMAARGLFAFAPNMRGRADSAGRRDSGGVEIMDIYDAIQAALVAFPDRIDANNLNIWGGSGGGGNVYSCMVRFPDLFQCGVALYGISDYGFDRHIGWYFAGAAPVHRAILDRDVGPPDHAVDRYMARASLLGAGNSRTTLHLFCDAEEAVCPLAFHTEYLSRAVAQGRDQIQLHLSGPGDAIRWTHDGRGYTLADVEAFYLDRTLANTHPVPTLPDAGRLTVLGFLRTRRFSVWLGDGQNAVADVDYTLSDTRQSFVFSLRTSDSRVRGWLTIPGPRPHAVLDNNQPTYSEYQDGATVIEINPSRAYTWLASADA